MLRPTISIPVANISLIINQRRGSPSLPSRITLLNRPQLTILIYVIRKHEDTGIRNVPEVVRCRRGERPNQNRRVRGGDLGLIGFGSEFNRDRIDVLNLCFVVGNHVCDDTRGQPERLSALGKWDLERLNGSFDRRDIDRLLVPTGSEIDASASGKKGLRKTCFRRRSPPGVLCSTRTTVRKASRKSMDT